MEAFFVYVFNKIIIPALVSLAIAKITQKKQEVTASGEDIELPTADEVRPIPYVAGINKIPGSNIIYAGAPQVKPTWKDGNILANKWYINLAVAICHSDADVVLHKILIDEKLAIDVQNPVHSDLAVFEMNDSVSAIKKYYSKFFNKKIGTSAFHSGIEGNAYFYDGGQNQQLNAELDSALGGNWPIYKDIAYCYFSKPLAGESFYWGTSSTIPVTEFVVSRLPTKLNSGLSDINGEANPAEVLYELLTDKDRYGLNIDPADIDTQSFLDAAQVFFDEKLGISLVLNAQNSLSEIKEKIESHCGFVLAKNATTGKFQINLIRENYDKNNILALNESNIISVDDYVKPLTQNLKTTVKVDYIDYYKEFNKRTVSADNKAMYFAKGESDSLKLEFDMFRNGGNAMRACQRELITASNPLISLKLKVNRSAVGVNLGDPILVSIDEYDVVARVFRVNEIDLGTLDNNEITLNLTEDLFQFQNPFLYVEPTFEVEDQIKNDFSSPTINSLFLLQEMPYFLAKDEPKNMAVVSKWSANASEYYFNFNYQNTVSGTVEPLEIDAGDYQKVAQISLSVTEHDNEIFLSEFPGNDFDRVINDLIPTTPIDTFGRRQGTVNLAMLHRSSDGLTEIISFEKIEYDQAQQRYKLTDVWRGLLDTNPKKYNSLDKVIILDEYFSEKQSNEIFKGVYRPDVYGPFNNFEAVGEDALSDFDVDIEQNLIWPDAGERFNKKLNVKNLKLNGAQFEESMSLAAQDDIVITFDFHDKVNDNFKKYDESDATTTSDYVHVVAYDVNDTFVGAWSTQTNSITITDSANYSHLRLEIWVDSSNNYNIKTDDSYEAYNIITSR